MSQPSLTAHIGRNVYHLRWDNSIEPALEVSSGAVVTFDALDSSGGQIVEGSSAAALDDLDFERVDQAHGPVAIRGAVPGDTLEVEILEVQTASWGWTAVIPGFGLLAEDYSEPALAVSTIADGYAQLPFGVRIPVRPFCGVMGVAPGPVGSYPTVPPGPFGGNMDTKHLVAGSTLYLPVLAPGALFSLGDGHAAQGDGEVCGTAIETSVSVTVALRLHKGTSIVAPEFTMPALADIPGPRFAAQGIGPDLESCARGAVRRLVDRLIARNGLSAEEAYMFCSVAADLRIAEIVDAPNWIVTASYPVSLIE